MLSDSMIFYINPLEQLATIRQKQSNNNKYFHFFWNLVPIHGQSTPFYGFKFQAFKQNNVRHEV